MKHTFWECRWNASNSWFLLVQREVYRMLTFVVLQGRVSLVWNLLRPLDNCIEYDSCLCSLGSWPTLLWRSPCTTAFHQVLTRWSFRYTQLVIGMVSQPSSNFGSGYSNIIQIDLLEKNSIKNNILLHLFDTPLTNSVHFTIT